MNCEKFKTLFSEMARESMMDAGDRSAALQHAAECTTCAVNLEDERVLTTSLGNLAIEMRSISAPPQVEAKLLAAFRDRSKPVPVVVPLVSQHYQRRYWAAAIAAALLIVFGLFVVRARLLNRPEPQQAQVPPHTINTEVAGAPAKDVIKEESSLLQVQQLNAPRKRIVRPRQATARLTTPASKALASNAGSQANFEVATDFFPIVYGNTPNLQEGGQLLRVELPREAVALWSPSKYGSLFKGPRLTFSSAPMDLLRRSALYTERTFARRIQIR